MNKDLGLLPETLCIVSGYRLYNLDRRSASSWHLESNKKEQFGYHKRNSSPNERIFSNNSYFPCNWKPRIGSCWNVRSCSVFLTQIWILLTCFILVSRHPGWKMKTILLIGFTMFLLTNGRDGYLLLLVTLCFKGDSTQSY